MKKRLLALLCLSMFVFSTACREVEKLEDVTNSSATSVDANATDSSTSDVDVNVTYYDYNSFRDAISEMDYLELNSTYRGHDHIEFQINADYLISVRYYQYSNPDMAYNEVVKVYNKYYQGILDNYYNGQLYYSEDGDQSYAIMDLKPTNPYREYHDSDFGLFPYYGVACRYNDMFVQIYSFEISDEDSELAKERVNEILETLVFPSPSMMPQDVVVSDDFEPLPLITFPESELDVTPMDIELSFDEAFDLLNEYFEIDPDSYYANEEIQYPFTVDDHDIQYLPDYSEWIMQMGIMDEHITNNLPEEYHYHILRELTFDGVIISEFEDYASAESRYKHLIQDAIGLNETTSDCDALGGYSFRVMYYYNSSDFYSFEAAYLVGNCVITFNDSAYDDAERYIKYLEVCTALGLPVSDEASALVVG